METIKIESVGDRGVAIGRLDGKAVFVRMAAPGDVALVRITGEKPGYSFAEIEKILEPSPLRVEPLCPRYGECGGCAWQHLSHAAALTGKAASIRGYFISRLRLGEDVFDDPIPSPKSYGYRNRLTLNLLPRGGELVAAMTGLRSCDSVEIAECPVAALEVNEALGRLRGSGRALKSIFPEGARALLQKDDEGSVWVMFEVEGDVGVKARNALAALGREAGFAGTWLKTGRSAPEPAEGGAGSRMPFTAWAAGAPCPMEVPVGCFVQANTEVNRALATVLATYSPLYSDGAFDLYCGSGNFTMTLAAGSRRVTGVEGDLRASGSATINASRNGFANVGIVNEPVSRFLRRRERSAPFWLMDPPRAGAPELAGLSPGEGLPRDVVYISCAPQTLARDIALLAGHGYGVRSVRAADMFPQTAHLEVFAHLARRL